MLIYISIYMVLRRGGGGQGVAGAGHGVGFGAVITVVDLVDLIKG